jgi:N-terminal domain of galactosyltransferase
MCVLRAANPARIRQERVAVRTFAASSVYRAAPPGAADPTAAEPGTDDLSRRITGYVVLANDPAVPLVAADYWQHSERFYRAVADEARALAGTDPAASQAYRHLAEHPDDVSAEAGLRKILGQALTRRPEHAAGCERAVAAADDNVYINYFLGDDYRPDAAPVTLDRLLELAPRSPRPAAGGDEILVVIPLMDREGSARVRNIIACLVALRDQTFSQRHVRITVVEFDTRPRWRHLVEPLADHYVHAQGSGRFNKSWSLNLAVRQTLGEARTLCLLDADILADREFLERNHARLADAGHDAHLPHTEFLSLDPAATDRLIEQRCLAGEARLASARGLLLRDGPGGCLWLRPELFSKVGGYDERYSGWGGEDEDMLVRVAAAGSAIQYDDVFLHLAHPRPPMRTPDGSPFNAHIQVGSWTGGSGYGDPAGPAGLAG